MPNGHGMNHEELLKQVNTRFDRLEEKIDKYAEQTTVNTQDISWLKGNLKIGVSALIAILGALVSYLLK